MFGRRQPNHMTDVTGCFARAIKNTTYMARNTINLGFLNGEINY